MKLRLTSVTLLVLAALSFAGCASSRTSEQQSRPSGSGGRGMSPGMAAETGVTGAAR